MSHRIMGGWPEVAAQIAEAYDELHAALARALEANRSRDSEADSYAFDDCYVWQELADAFDVLRRHQSLDHLTPP